jgi:hypothetical protein
MPAKHKAIAAMLLLLALGFGAGGCAARMPRGFPEDSESRVVAAEDGAEEEVLSDDDEEDDFGRRDRGSETVAGEFLVVVGYVAVLIGSAILPLLLL